MTSLYLLILVYFMINKKVRFLVYGVIYYFIDTIKAYLDKEPLEKWINDNVKSKPKNKR